MASRPVFLPSDDDSSEVIVRTIEFDWFPGLSKSQKLKCVNSLHLSAKSHGINDILEISSKSDTSLGIELSAFNLLYSFEDKFLPVECIFQSSKVFEEGGPFEELRYISPREAKRDERLNSSGDLIGFEFEGIFWEQTPQTAFYDWIYIHALSKRHELMEKLKNFSAFTDIEFNPNKQINCQARSVAFFKTLSNRGILEESLKNQSFFIKNYRNSGETNIQMKLF